MHNHNTCKIDRRNDGTTKSSDAMSQARPNARSAGMCQSRWRSPLSLTLRRVVLLHPGEEGKRWGLSEVSSSSRSLNKVVASKSSSKSFCGSSQWRAKQKHERCRLLPKDTHMDFFFLFFHIETKTLNPKRTTSLCLCFLLHQTKTKILERERGRAFDTFFSPSFIKSAFSILYLLFP